MTNTICLDKNYSTTRLLTQEKPVIINNPGDKFETVLFLPEGEGRKGEGGLRTKGYFKRSFEDKPLISIITVVFNGEKYLEETIQSVIKQTYDNVEYIIIDGGSTDGTMGIIKKYEHAIDYWVSEKDNGIYHAMNKGLSLAIGDYIALLNCGDWYEIDACEQVLKYILLYKYDIYYGLIRNFDKNIFRNVSGSTINNLQKSMIAHPTCFISKYVYSKYKYNVKYKSASDYDLIIRLYKAGFKFYFIERIIANFNLGGISESYLGIIESLRIKKKYEYISYTKYILLIIQASITKILRLVINKFYCMDR